MEAAKSGVVPTPASTAPQSAQGRSPAPRPTETIVPEVAEAPNHPPSGSSGEYPLSSLGCPASARTRLPAPAARCSPPSAKRSPPSARRSPPATRRFPPPVAGPPATSKAGPLLHYAKLCPPPADPTPAADDQAPFADPPHAGA